MISSPFNQWGVGRPTIFLLPPNNHFPDPLREVISLKMNLKGCFPAELQEYFIATGEPAYRGLQAFRRIHRHRAIDYEEFSDFPRMLREKLTVEAPLPRLLLQDSVRSEDGTEKLLFSIGRDRQGKRPIEIETVWLVAPRRRTACISSQAGCALNCSFCATGKLKFRGNLEAWQIVDQVYELIRNRGEHPTNIVFMGMGEPFLNYENVLRAAHLLHHPDGLNLGARHITISTSGIIPGIERFIQDREPFNLAISLNHPDPAVRGKIMGIDRKYPLEKLLASARKFTRALRRAVTFEYVLIPGVNMSEENARQLVRIARRIRCKINLIPLNTTLSGFRPPSPGEIERFQEILFAADLAVFNRGAPGRDINAACGMLALNSADRQSQRKPHTSGR